MICLYCEEEFFSLQPHAKYCSQHHQILAKNARYYQRNKQRLLENSKQYFQKNKFKFAARCAKRYAAKTNSTPNWLTEWDKFFIEELYDIASRRGLHVDHVIPLRGKTVCGLHVPENLALLTPEENRKKSNSYETSKRERKKA